MLWLETPKIRLRGPHKNLLARRTCRIRTLVITIPAVFFSLWALGPSISLGQPQGHDTRISALLSTFERLPPSLLASVGRRIWHNECQGTVAGLTTWNHGESFPSLGIGHFIWYPPGGRDRFSESFPDLLVFFRQRGVILPAWLETSPACPWPDKSAFDAAHNSKPLRELRYLLSSTIMLQAEFMARRLAASVPAMTKGLSPKCRGSVIDRVTALSQSADGLYALVDYVNFKGEGTSPTERYRGQGWGLLQVLQGMPRASEGDEALLAFSRSARQVLERRVANAPTERQPQEKRWLPGWIRRVESYRPGHAKPR
jgi:hypothetical protein